MSGYPRVIFTRGVSVTVTSAADEAFWRGETTVSAPDTFAVTTEPTPEPASKPVRVAPVKTHTLKPAPKPVAAKGTKKK